jgi:hypothetical protein
MFLEFSKHDKNYFKRFDINSMFYFGAKIMLFSKVLRF